MYNDVGLKNIVGLHHRNGSDNSLNKLIFALLSLSPHRVIDGILTPKRSKIGDGLVYSWKAVFGWRQICVLASKS